jgi:hypothetical protein
VPKKKVVGEIEGRNARNLCAVPKSAKNSNFQTWNNLKNRLKTLVSDLKPVLEQFLRATTLAKLHEMWKHVLVLEKGNAWKRDTPK